MQHKNIKKIREKLSKNRNYYCPNYFYMLYTAFYLQMVRGRIMVLIVDGNTEHVAQRKIDLLGEKKMICDCSRSNALNRSDIRDCSLRASYRLIQVPWKEFFVVSFYVIV